MNIRMKHGRAFWITEMERILKWWKLIFGSLSNVLLVSGWSKGLRSNLVFVYT